MKATDEQILKAVGSCGHGIPGYTSVIAHMVGLSDSATAARLNKLHAQGKVTKHSGYPNLWGLVR